MKKIIYGVSYKGITYGWLEKELYRLPVTIGTRNFGVKKLTKIPIGRQFGYKLSQKSFALKQLESMTCLLLTPFVIKEIKHESTPF